MTTPPPWRAERAFIAAGSVVGVIALSLAGLLHWELRAPGMELFDELSPDVADLARYSHGLLLSTFALPAILFAGIARRLAAEQIPIAAARRDLMGATALALWAVGAAMEIAALGYAAFSHFEVGFSAGGAGPGWEALLLDLMPAGFGAAMAAYLLIGAAILWRFVAYGGWRSRAPIVWAASAAALLAVGLGGYNLRLAALALIDAARTPYFAAMMADNSIAAAPPWAPAPTAPIGKLILIASLLGVVWTALYSHLSNRLLNAVASIAVLVVSIAATAPWAVAAMRIQPASGAFGFVDIVDLLSKYEAVALPILIALLVAYMPTSSARASNAASAFARGAVAVMIAVGLMRYFGGPSRFGLTLQETLAHTAHQHGMVFLPALFAACAGWVLIQPEAQSSTLREITQVAALVMSLGAILLIAMLERLGRSAVPRGYIDYPEAFASAYGAAALGAAVLISGLALFLGAALLGRIPDKTA